MKRPLPTPQNLAGLIIRIEGLRGRAGSYRDRAVEKDAGLVAEQLDQAERKLVAAKRAVERAVDALEDVLETTTEPE